MRIALAISILTTVFLGVACGGDDDQESRPTGLADNAPTDNPYTSQSPVPTATPVSAALGESVEANGYRVTVSNYQTLTEFAQGYESVLPEEGFVGVGMVDVEACRLNELAEPFDSLATEDTGYRRLQADSYPLEYVGLDSDRDGLPVGVAPDVGDCLTGKIAIGLYEDAYLKTVIWDPRTLVNQDVTIVEWSVLD